MHVDQISFHSPADDTKLCSGKDASSIKTIYHSTKIVRKRPMFVFEDHPPGFNVYTMYVHVNDQFIQMDKMILEFTSRRTQTESLRIIFTSVC